MPHYFVSYSSREPHVQILLDALSLVLGAHFQQRRTPEALVSGKSQFDRIVKGIAQASFCVVILDGLRPNVVLEYGIMIGKEKSVLLFQEQFAEVDAPGLFPEGFEVERTPLNIDTQVSDIKDLNRATWFRNDPKKTRRLVLEEYRKKRKEIPDFVEIEGTGPLFN